MGDAVMVSVSCDVGGCNRSASVVATEFVGAVLKQSEWRAVTALGGWCFDAKNGDTCPEHNPNIPDGHLEAT